MIFASLTSDQDFPHRSVISIAGSQRVHHDQLIQISHRKRPQGKRLPDCNAVCEVGSPKARGSARSIPTTAMSRRREKPNAKNRAQMIEMEMPHSFCDGSDVPVSNANMSVNRSAPGNSQYIEK